MATTLNLDIAQELDITVRKGDNFSFTVTVKDSNGDAVDINPANYTFNMDVRTSTDRSSRDNVILSSAGIPGGLTATGAADGTLTIEGGVIAMIIFKRGVMFMTYSLLKQKHLFIKLGFLVSSLLMLISQTTMHNGYKLYST